MKIFFPGSFNPFTKGHADILERLLGFAQNVTIGIGRNADKAFEAAASDKNKKAIEDYISRNGLSERVDVVVYDGLTAEEALSHGADCMARGVRNSSDYELESSLAAANRKAFGIDTILIPADPKFSFVSSSMIRDLENHGRKDIAQNFIP